jgi:hypothetical protein
MPKYSARIVVAALTLGAVGIGSPAAAGTGCNGVVNIFVWGCAPWDNNNGAKFPYYRKKAITIPKQGTQIVTKDGVTMALRNGTYYPLIGQDGAGVIGQDGAGFRVWSQ